LRAFSTEILRSPRAICALSLIAACLLAGCRSAADYRAQADGVANKIIEQKQQEVLGRTEAMDIVSPADTLRRRLLLDQNLPYSTPMSLGVHDLPRNEYWNPEKHLISGEPASPVRVEEPLRLTILDALQISARSSRDYQAAKEKVFTVALDLDLERNDFRNTFAGMLSGLLNHDRGGDEPVTGTHGEADASIRRTLKSGIELTTAIALDLVKLLTQDRASSFGITADATISIPLLRGAGRMIVAEPLTQAERNVVYAIYEFERFKKTFAVRVANDYLSVLQQLQEVANEEESYKRLIASARRTRRLADAGRIPETQFDQGVQDELRARSRWISARQSYASRLDSFRVLLGLPADAELELDTKELELLLDSLKEFTAEVDIADYADTIPPADAPIVLQEPSGENAGPWELDPGKAVKLALDNRLDLRVAKGEVEDAERKVMVAADSLRAELSLLGSASAGQGRSISSAGSDDARLDPNEGTYSALLDLDLPLERVAERTTYRKRLIALEQAVRNLQDLEDRTKLDVRAALRALLEARESLKIQGQAVTLAEKRVKSTDLFLQAGRAEVRDVLDAQEALLSAQNALIDAAVRYRITELELQRDMGLLQVDEKGLWQENIPQEEEPS